jgi:hypothetical protein
LYKRFQEEDYSYVILPSDPQMRGVDDLVFINTRKSCLHFVVARTPIMPCSEAIDWIIAHGDVEHRTILNEEGRCIGVYLPFELEKYYNCSNQRYT